jgi:hypothetical protein
MSAEAARTLRPSEPGRPAIPICSSCKRIRDPAGTWWPGGRALENDPELSFTHGICPECAEQIYPGLFEKPVGEPA